MAVLCLEPHVVNAIFTNNRCLDSQDTKTQNYGLREEGGISMGKVRIEKGAGLCRTRPCMIITTLHENRIVNAGTFGSYTNAGPQEIAIAIGRLSHTYANIKRTGEFIINIPHIGITAALEICGQNVPTTESELDKANLTTEPADEIKTPMISECVANIECKYWKEVEIGHHVVVLGKTVCGHLDKRYVDQDGSIDVVKARVPFNIRYPSPIYAVLASVD